MRCSGRTNYVLIRNLVEQNYVLGIVIRHYPVVSWSGVWIASANQIVPRHHASFQILTFFICNVWRNQICVNLGPCCLIRKVFVLIAEARPRKTAITEIVLMHFIEHWIEHWLVLLALCILKLRRILTLLRLLTKVWKWRHRWEMEALLELDSCVIWVTN